MMSDNKMQTHTGVDRSIDELKKFLHTYIDMQFNLENEQRFDVEAIENAQQLLDEYWSRLLISSELKSAASVRELRGFTVHNTCVMIERVYGYL